MGVYGYSRNTTPNIDKLAEASLVFTNAYTHASWTLPASMSMFTSRYPFEHRVFDGKIRTGVIQKLDETTVSLVDVLADSGYKTAAFTGDRDYIPLYGLLNRFEHYQYYMADKKRTGTTDERFLWAQYGVLSNIIPEAVRWLQGNQNKRFYLFLQAYDLHCPFALPEENSCFDRKYKGDIDFKEFFWNYDTQEPVTISGKEYFSLKTTIPGKPEILLSNRDIEHMKALYDGEISNADKHLSTLFDYMASQGLFNNTLLVLTAEHGEMLGEHGRFLRSGPLKASFFEPVMNIPLIIFHPAIKHRKIDALVQMVDLAPTLLDILDIDIPESFSGTSLAGTVYNNEPANPFVVAYSEYLEDDSAEFFKNNIRIASIRDNKWKLIIEEEDDNGSLISKNRFYDMEIDPGENNDISSISADSVLKYKKILEKFISAGFVPDK
jgi:arylsulfatase A-like enzyme